MASFDSRKIIALERLKKGKIKVYTNKGDTILADAIIVKYRILKDSEIDDITWNLALSEETKEEAIIKASGYLALQTKSERQMHDYLMGKGYSETVTQEAIKFLKDHNLINDYQYVKYRVDKHKRDLKGPMLCKTELEQAVDSKLVSYGLSLYTDSEQEEILKTFMDKKLKTKSKSVISKQALINSLKRSALTRGFNSRMINAYINQLDLEESLEALELDYHKLLRKYDIDHMSYEEKYEASQKIKQSLLRKGYSYQDIKTIMNKKSCE